MIKRPFLNIFRCGGLVLALTGIIFISLLVKHELSYDTFHENANNIYRFTYASTDFAQGKHFARIGKAALISTFPEQIPEVKGFVRLTSMNGGVLKHNDKFIELKQGFQCDKSFFDIFTVHLIKGNKQHVLSKPGSMVISKSYGEKVFGNSNPIGKTLTLPSGQYYGEDYPFTITGIIEDFPVNSHFHPEVIVSPLDKDMFKGWAWTYLLCTPNANMGNLGQKINTYIQHVKEKENDFGYQGTAYLQPLKDIHLYSHKLRELENNGNITNIYVLLTAALLLVLISIINYGNLSIGMASYSFKYLRVSNMIGSAKNIGLYYFMLEGIFISLITIVFTLLCIYPVNTLLTTNVQIHLLACNKWFITGIIIVFTLLILLTACTPFLNLKFSSFLSFQKETVSLNIKRQSTNKVLVVLQYTFSILLVISLCVITRQNNFAMKKGMGVQENNIFCLDHVHNSIQRKFETFKSELLKQASIESVTAMLEPPGDEANDMFVFEMEDYDSVNNLDHEMKIGILPCDYSFASLFHLTFLSGQNFSETNIDAEGSGEYIINCSAMKRLGFTNPDDIINKSFKLNFNNAVPIPKGKIIGVVEDFNLSSIKKEVEPLVLFKRSDLWLINFLVSHKPGMKAQAIADTRNLWHSMFPAYPFRYNHVDAMYKNVYKTERLQQKLLLVFTIIALIICSLGLLSLSLIVAQNRIKEIGIRKVNGAKTLQILNLLNTDFLKYIVFAFVLACPIAYYAMSIWLQTFTYSIKLQWWIFAVSGIFTFAIALLTVSWQSWKAASRNPVEALRYE